MVCGGYYCPGEHNPGNEEDTAGKSLLSNSQCRGIVLGNGINGMRWNEPHGFVITFFSLSQCRP